MSGRPAELISRLEIEGARLVRWLREADREELTWKPAPERWSMLEVAGHLCAEEFEDFRARVRLTLEGAPEWPPIDPEGSITVHGWQQRDPAEVIDRFEAERAESVAWLRSLDDPQWSRIYDHPEVGPTSALDLLASWVAHDLLHGAQLARLRVEAFRASIPALSIRYADPRMD